MDPSSGGFCGGNGGNVNYVNYDSVSDLFYAQKQAIAGWYLENVAGKTISTLVSINSYGAGGGGGGANNSGSVKSGGGAGGGHIIVTANSFDNSDSIISANGGAGGNSNYCEYSGGGGGGGMIYGLYNTLTDEGVLTVSGGTRQTCSRFLAEKEIAVWFDKKELVNYRLVQEQILYDVNLDGILE